MKLPELLVPKKMDFDKGVENLMRGRIKDIKDLTDLILKNIDFDEFARYFEETDVGEDYFLSSGLIEKRIKVEYDDAIIHLYEIDEDLTLRLLGLGTLNGLIRDFLSDYNSKQTETFSEVSAILKDKYVVFVYTGFGDHYRKRKFINTYVNEFGFKEVKEG